MHIWKEDTALEKLLYVSKEKLIASIKNSVVHSANSQNDEALVGKCFVFDELWTCIVDISHAMMNLIWKGSALSGTGRDAGISVVFFLGF